MTKSKALYLVFFGVAFALIGLWFSGYSLTELVLGWAHWMSGQGLWGRVCFGVAYFLAALAVIPLLPLGVLAGMAYGAVEGFFVVMPGALAAAALAGWLGRSVFRQPLLRLVEEKPAWQAVCGALADRGVYAVILNRLAPVMPFSVQNYVLGAVGVSVRSLFWGTLVGMQPALWVALYLGGLVTTLAEAKTMVSHGTFVGPRLYLMVVGAAAVLTLALWLGRVARRALAESSDVGSVR